MTGHGKGHFEAGSPNATATIVSSTVSGNTGDNIVNAAPTAGAFTLTNSLVVTSGEPHASACTRVDDAISLGHNIESPGNTCGPSG